MTSRRQLRVQPGVGLLPSATRLIQTVSAHLAENRPQGLSSLESAPGSLDSALRRLAYHQPRRQSVRALQVVSISTGITSRACKYMTISPPWTSRLDAEKSTDQCQWVRAHKWDEICENGGGGYRIR
jgi:hypothetical protein